MDLLLPESFRRPAVGSNANRGNLPEPPKLEIKKDPKGLVTVVGATDLPVTSEKQLLSAIEQVSALLAACQRLGASAAYHGTGAGLCITIVVLACCAHMRACAHTHTHAHAVSSAGTICCLLASCVRVRGFVCAAALMLMCSVPFPGPDLCRALLAATRPALP